MDKHSVFVGSSTQSAWFAREIGERMDACADMRPWYIPANWKLGAATLSSLIETISKCDFALLLLADDDWQQVGSAPPHSATRDNVLFELGLCMGMLGGDRVMFFYSDSADFKLPSDLAGITGIPVSFDTSASSEDRDARLKLACDRVRSHMKEVAEGHVAKGKEVMPELQLEARFPKEDGAADKSLPYLSSGAATKLKVSAVIADEDVDAVFVYFPFRLNLAHVGWTYKQDKRGPYFYATKPQVREMKRGRGWVTFEVQTPRAGAHELVVVALVRGEARYEKTFVLNVN